MTGKMNGRYAIIHRRPIIGSDTQRLIFVWIVLSGGRIDVIEEVWGQGLFDTGEMGGRIQVVAAAILGIGEEGAVIVIAGDGYQSGGADACLL